VPKKGVRPAIFFFAFFRVFHSHLVVIKTFHYNLYIGKKFFKIKREFKMGKEISIISEKAKFINEKVSECRNVKDFAWEIIKNNKKDIRNVDKYLRIILESTKLEITLMQSHHFIPKDWIEGSSQEIKSHEESLNEMDEKF